MRPLRIKRARRRFTAARDDHGVPHVAADDWPTALYALGYLHALDRGTQLLFARVVALGQSSQWIADEPGLVETDKFFRRAGLHLHLERELASLGDEPRAQMQAYADGINDGLTQAGRSLPLWATGYRPQPWDVPAILLVGNLLNYGGLAVHQQRNERLILELLQAGVADDRLRELFSPYLDGADFDLLRQVKISSRLSDEALELMSDLPHFAGSNAWAVSPTRSVTGHALLASDPHLEVNRLPAIWYEAVLRAGDDYLLGASLPGSPTFAVARTRSLAWGVTYVKGDTTDYFVEEVRRRPQGWQYRRGDEWRDFQVRIERIVRKGGAVESMAVLYNDLGALDGDPQATGPGYYLTVAWTGESPGTGRSLETWLQLPHTATALEAMDLVRACPQPTLGWVFADRQGHIGMQVSGRYPQRPAHYSGLYPVPAWEERNRWQGWVDPALLPRRYDPPEGFVATANEDVTAHGGPRLISVPLPNYRKRRIEERLAELPRAALADMQALQYDVVSTQARDLLPIFLPHVLDGPLRQRLAEWDHSYPPSSVEATLFQRLYRHVLLEVFGQDSAEGGIGWRRMLYLCTRAGFSMMTITALDRLLTKEQSLWWTGRDKGELIRRAAERAAAEPDQSWAVTNAFNFTNRFFENRFAGRALGFHTGEMPMPGCHATPFQGHLLRVATRETTFAPSYHFVTDLGSDEAWTNLPGGPSESRFSRWYKCDLPLWASGAYKQLIGPQAVADGSSA
jgi:penicillin amidase